MADKCCGGRVAHIHVSPLAPSFISKWTERICNRGHICFSLLCILNKSCDECTFQFIHCGIRKWIICLPIPSRPSAWDPSVLGRPTTCAYKSMHGGSRAVAMVFVVCGRTCCRFDVWPTIYLQSCAMPIVRIESGLVWSLQLRFMVQFTITLKIQLSFCSTFAVEWWCHKDRSTDQSSHIVVVIRSRYYIRDESALCSLCRGGLTYSTSCLAVLPPGATTCWLSGH